MKNDVVEKTEYNRLISRVHSIDTTDFVRKTNYDTNKSGLEKKISGIKTTIGKGSGVASKDELNAVGFLLTSVFNSKITEVENKIPDIKNLASKTELTTVENKIPDTD